MNVKTISRDLASYYDWTARQVFMNAIQIADKFHIIKKVLDSLQDLRIFYKQSHLLAQKEHHDSHKKLEKINRSKSRINGTIYNQQKYKPLQIKLANGETLSQILHRSRSLLFKYRKDWTVSQHQRAKVLFDYEPEIEKVYSLVIKFRTWYSKGNIGKSIFEIKSKLNE